MALSDYLTGPEWDACFYASMGQHSADNFGDSMTKTIRALLDSGYVFSGLDNEGCKANYIGGPENARKVMLFFGNHGNVDVLEILDSGRRFLQRILPSLIDETDDEWAEQMTRARTSEGAVKP